MEQRSDLVAEGKLIEESSYRDRASRWQQLELDGIKIDHFDATRGIIKEVKKSSKREAAHVAQLKYYLFVLERNGIHVSHGLLEYPRLRETQEVWLNDTDREEIPEWESTVKNLRQQANCPPLLKKSLCKRCAYHEFCYS